MIGERPNHPIEDRLAEEAAVIRVRELERENAKLREQIATLPKALYDADGIYVIGDGCSTRERDEWIIGEIIKQHFA